MHENGDTRGISTLLILRIEIRGSCSMSKIMVRHSMLYTYFVNQGLRKLIIKRSKALKASILQEN